MWLQATKENPENSSKFAIRDQSSFPKGAQSGTSKSWMNLQDFLSFSLLGQRIQTISGLTSGIYYQDVFGRAGWGNLQGWPGREAPCSTTAGMFQSCSLFGDISLGSWVSLSFRKNSLQWFALGSFADFPSGRSRRNGCPDVLCESTAAFPKHFPGCWGRAVVLGSLIAELWNNQSQQYPVGVDQPLGLCFWWNAECRTQNSLSLALPRRGQSISDRGKMLEQ